MNFLTHKGIPSKKYIVFYIIIAFFFFSKKIYANEQLDFSGEGTKTNPYLIESYEDLCEFRDLVNDGNDFTDIYFLQTVNIDMKKKSWTPIGNKKNHPFSGIYNGNGHFLENVNIDSNDISAIFAYLDGVIANIGIESGTINGNMAAGIAGTATNPKASVLNCYNKANITGEFVGGIAGDFKKGTIAVCWNAGKLEGTIIGGILSKGEAVKIYSCFATNEFLIPENIVSTTSYTLSLEELYSDSIEKKLNISTALSQYMYANELGVMLKQWENNKPSGITYSVQENYIKTVGIFNDFFPNIVLFITIIFAYLNLVSLHNKKQLFTENKYLSALIIISGIVTLFCDTAIIFKGTSYLRYSNTIFILLINLLFFSLFIYFFIQIKKFNFKIKKEWIPLVTVIFIVVILEMNQFKLVPKFDACLYYGSFIEGIERFQLDFITYIGAFVCWKWIQGLGLLIAPFEFLFPGQMIGVYIANIIITIITLICLYWLLRQMYQELSPITAAICCGIFMASPYALGMFTYLCMDWHLPFFCVWLLCCIRKKNDYLICFVGYLLAFTKITGIVFYCGVLLFVGIKEIFDEDENTLLRKLASWWNWKKIILWLLPAILFLGTYLYGDHITIQNFYGTYVSEQTLKLDNWRHFANVILQTFVFAFRWVILLLLILALLIFLFKKENTIFTDFGKTIILGIITGFSLTLVVLCLYNSDADCPRYTTIFNLFYILFLPFIMGVLFKKNRYINMICMAMACLFLVQTYWTIDPFIKNIGESIDTGKKKMYKLALPNDPRVGMNLGSWYGQSQVLGDLYTYNLEHAFYDNLLEQMLRDIQPRETDIFYILDIIDYEMHLIGNSNRTYEIYWNTETQTRTYNKWSKNNVYINEQEITTKMIQDYIETSQLPSSFYLIVVPRINESKAINSIIGNGYEEVYSFHLENIYGKLSVYKFKRTEH